MCKSFQLWNRIEFTGHVHMKFDFPNLTDIQLLQEFFVKNINLFDNEADTNEDPKDKVCLYIFIKDTPVPSIDISSIGAKKIVSVSWLRVIINMSSKCNSFIDWKCEKLTKFDLCTSHN